MSGSHHAHEWVGAQTLLPGLVEEAGHSYQPRLLLLIEVGGPIVGHAWAKPQAGGITMAELLQKTILQPLDGPPRRPSRVRFADPKLANEVRAAKLGIDVVVAPTPEIDEAMESFRAFAEESASRPKPRASDGVTEFFRATKKLYETAPWTALTDADVLRIDIPALDVIGGCFSLKGNKGGERGFLFYLSLTDFKAFARLVAETHQGRADTDDSDLSILSLTFQRGADTPQGMRRDIAEHGWPVADAHAYPIAERLELTKGLRKFPHDRDMQILTACARAVAAFTRAHGAAIDVAHFFAIEEFADDSGLTVRVSFPYEAGDDSWWLTAPNDAHARLVRRVILHAAEQFGPAWCRERDAFSVFEHERDLGVPFLAFEAHLRGRSAGAWFRDQRASGLPEDELAWLAAELAGWLSVWLVVDVDHDRGDVVLEDLLTGKVFGVIARETTGVRPGEAILARIIEHDGEAVMSGMHTRILRSQFTYVTDRIRRRLRRVTAIPIERLRAAGVAAAMIRAWTKAVAIEDALEEARHPQRRRR